MKRVNWKRQSEIECAAKHNFIGECLKMRRALRFYANPEVYEPRSTGEYTDIRFVAIEAIACFDEFLENGLRR